MCFLPRASVLRTTYRSRLSPWKQFFLLFHLSVVYHDEETLTFHVVVTYELLAGLRLAAIIVDIATCLCRVFRGSGHSGGVYAPVGCHGGNSSCHGRQSTSL